jgi:hypothetical protein
MSHSFKQGVRRASVFIESRYGRKGSPGNFRRVDPVSELSCDYATFECFEEGVSRNVEVERPKCRCRFVQECGSRRRIRERNAEASVETRCFGLQERISEEDAGLLEQRVCALRKAGVQRSDSSAEESPALVIPPRGQVRCFEEEGRFGCVASATS